MTGIKILSTGKAVPRKVITNEDLSKIVDTSDEWIKKRTGMSERHYVSEGESTTSLSRDAALLALQNSGLCPEDIGVVIVATVSADNFAPSTACLLQKELGLRTDIIAMDINAACSGFIFGMETMRGLLMSTKSRAGIIVGVESLSKKLDMTDRTTCVLFGDGAAAAVVALEEGDYCAVTGVESDDEMINCSVKDGIIKMDGQATYKFAVSAVPSLINRILEKSGFGADEIDHFILHQANRRIIESIAEKLNQPLDKFIVNIERYGNTSAASVGLALADANDACLISRGDKVLMCAFGAGKTYGAMVFDW